MPWPGAILRISVMLLAATVNSPGVFSEENIGCLFSERLCLEEEWCFDDYAFGRCLPSKGEITKADLYRYDLEKYVLHEISRELRRLFALGYRWSHGYTQCRLQSMLYATKHDIYFETNSCSHLIDQDLEGALKALEGQDVLDPNEMAIVKYTPSIDNPHADFADEVYYPPVDYTPLDNFQENLLPPSLLEYADEPTAQYDIIKRTWIPQMHRRGSPPKYLYDRNTPDSRFGREARDDLEFLPHLQDDFTTNNNEINDKDDYMSEEDSSKLQLILEYLNEMGLDPSEIRLVLMTFGSENFDKLLQELEKLNEKSQKLSLKEYLMYKNELQEQQELDKDPFERFTGTYNTPEKFRAGWESRDVLPYADYFPESRIYVDEADDQNEYSEFGSGFDNTPLTASNIPKNEFTPSNNLNSGIFRELKMKGSVAGHKEDQPFHPGIYTEGGVVSVPDSPQIDQRTEDSLEDLWKTRLDKILAKYNLGFKRPERLDVKKPGPPYNTQTLQERKVAFSKLNENDDILPSMMKKGPIGVHPYPSHENFDVDTDYVYVQFKNSIKSWQEGQHIISNISYLLKLESSAFTHGRVDRHEVTFKVIPNSKGLNASDVAKKIEFIKDDLETATGVEVTSAGIGDKTKMQTLVSKPMVSRVDQFYIVILTVCSVLAAMIIAISLLLLIKRHIRYKEKLQGLAHPDTEASKDYQDLCRARMATKGQVASETVHGRITSLSRESEQSPSSRSSTSSWSEEPALHNMDISTGHMVLSYMEDHLKNKDRLEQEWVALCAYVAEPCETTVSLKGENVEKNRCNDVVPYDHSRVVLNELSNANSSDYINASSITDHDPRNPAYIATQGPLPHTAPDFWQLIWEQGAVVIVMLTRLTEGGTAMCHRYWPEEGSELYHIYEVHLVSEHIWCDDYLVRSFYLKNIRTGETRTVTQFHFLSWPETGVPASTKALLEFRRKVNKSYRGRSCPIVVHCSDGAGRTGTYCLIDMVLSRMAKGAKEIDIAATLEHLRDQRPRMVATKQQFEFVLTAVAEEVHAILKALPPPPPTTTTEKEKP